MSYKDIILQGDALERLKEIPSDYIDCVFTSTPYWGLRDYGNSNIKIWGGNPECEHTFIEEEINEVCHLNKDFNERWGHAPGAKKQEEQRVIHSISGFCSKCGAWKGQLGLEPHPQMFIEHIVDIFREVRRVLKPSGTVFLNLGDTYFGGKGQSGRKDHNIEQRIAEGRTLQKKQWTLGDQDYPQDLCKADGKWLQPKQKLQIPSRTSAAMQDDGWLLRNTIIWYKRNHMPESMDDRFTRSYEEIFFFVKNPTYDFNLDAVRVPSHTVPWTTKPSKKAYDGNNPRSNYAGKFDKLIAESVGSPRARLATREVVNFYNAKGKNPGDVWEVSTEQSSLKHFAMFPMQLVKRGLLCGCPKDGIVLDPFAGAGTTLCVARKMGLHYIGIEMNPEYIAIAKKRLIKNKFVQPHPNQKMLEVIA